MSRPISLPPCQRLSDDRGSMAISWLFGMTFLVVPSLMLVLAVPVWEARSVDASDLARAAVRALTLYPNWADAELAASQSVVQTEADDSLPSGDVTASFNYTLPIGGVIGADGALPPGSRVKASVTVLVPAGYIPGIGAYASFHYTASYTGRIDSYAADNS
jgi:hypothetical protein